MPVITLQRRRDYAGPAFFSYGFRPFFLSGAVWAAFGILLWLPLLFGEAALPTHLGVLDWHIHEMLYGYAAATIAGFILTAIPNWTGRLPINGAPLAALAALWLAGRLAIAFSAAIGAAAAAVIDVAFLAILAAAVGREIVAGRNWRNLRVLAVLGVFILGNVVFHTEALVFGKAEHGIRIAVAAVIGLITIIGGRIVPSFTRNWLVRNRPGRLPIAFSSFDVLCVAASILALLAWVVTPSHRTTGLLLLAAGIAQAVRLGRWAGDRTVSDRLVLVLHVGYAFVPIGFILLGVGALTAAVPASAGIHAWTTGAVGLMTLSVMTRASLGHTGQPLMASPGTQAIYSLALAAALLRIAAAFDGSTVLIHLAAFAWIAAFGGFTLAYGPMLVGRLPAWKDARH